MERTDALSQPEALALVDRAANLHALHGSREDAARLRELRATLVTLYEDRERLDWLAHVARTATVYMDGNHPWNLTGNLYVRDLRGPTFRAAIDRARGQEEGR